MKPETELALNLFSLRFRLALFSRALMADPAYEALEGERIDELSRFAWRASIDIDRICDALKQLGVSIPPSLVSMRSLDEAKQFAALHELPMGEASEADFQTSEDDEKECA